MKVLVTGGAGFIGSHLMRCLVENGHEAVAVDDLSCGQRENLLPDMDLIEENILSDKFAGIVASGGYDSIVHLAAQTMVSTSMDDPLLDARQNILGTISVLEAARRAGVGRVIFASTAASYGDVPEKDLPVKESHKQAPMSFYGLSKTTVEHYLDVYHQAFGIDYVVLRFANVYGERQGNGGEGGVISIFCNAIANGKDITIFGDGEQTRDFVYAGDIARGILAALKAPKKAANVAYNLSTQTETSLRELVSVLCNVSGRKIIPKYGPERAGDIYKSMLSNGRARRGLGWAPVTSLEQGLKATYEYFKSQK
ncbi:MAG: NAD-dependent epimerase/dehydratase family protein [Selenomonadaceae bacterium]